MGGSLKSTYTPLIYLWHQWHQWPFSRKVLLNHWFPDLHHSIIGKTIPLTRKTNGWPHFLYCLQVWPVHLSSTASLGRKFQPCNLPSKYWCLISPLLHRDTELSISFRLQNGLAAFSPELLTCPGCNIQSMLHQSNRFTISWTFKPLLKSPILVLWQTWDPNSQLLDHWFRPLTTIH